MFRLNEKVLLWYKNTTMPYHNQIGTLLVVSNGKPKNVLVRVNPNHVVVPFGNIRKVPPNWKRQVSLF